MTSKDSLATQLDIEHLGIRKELHLVELENGQFELPVASWTLKKEEKRALISFFNELKVPLSPFISLPNSQTLCYSIATVFRIALSRTGAFAGAR